MWKIIAIVLTISVLCCCNSSAQKNDSKKQNTQVQDTVNEYNRRHLKEYVRKNINKEYNSISVLFENEIDKVLTIGQKIEEIDNKAYMNGYNWDVLFNYYLAKNYPDILVGLESDPEAGCYIASYKLNEENEVRADKFIEIIKSLIENEEELYRIVREEGNNIEWD